MAWEPHRAILTLSLDVCSEVLFQGKSMRNIESGERPESNEVRTIS
jgi:hypothetical protein